jgi:hypothetical protein
MPAHGGIRPDEDQCAAPVPPRLGKHDPEEPVSRAKLRSFAGARQSSQLLTKRQILKRNRSVTAADQADSSEEDHER